MGITSTLSITAQAFKAQQLAIQTTGHYLANGATPGYSRQHAAGLDLDGAAGGVDVFDIYLELENGLQNNDVNGPDGIRTQIGHLDVALDQILSFRAEFGDRVNNAQAIKDAIGVMKIQTNEQRSQIEDAVVPAVYSGFARYQHALQAALQSAAQVIRPSLLDYLR